MWMLTTLCLNYIILFAFYINWLINTDEARIQECAAIWQEYKESNILEVERITKLPPKFRKVNKKTARKISDKLCSILNLPQIDGILLGWRLCKGYTTANYMLELPIKHTTIIMNGIWSVNVAILIHELAHHYDAFIYQKPIISCELGHGESFIKCETKLFDMLESLIASKEINYD